MQLSRTWAWIAAVFVGVAMSTSTAAQTLPWETFTDGISGSVCDVINAGNAELVLLRSTGQLVLVTGRDVTLEDTFVDEANNVFYFDQQVGFIDFAEDGDGLRTLWWVSLTGRTIDIDGLSGEPFESQSSPFDFNEVACDACPLWDDPTICEGPPTIIEGPTTVTLCGTNVTIGMIGSMMGLIMLRFSQRRRKIRGR